MVKNPFCAHVLVIPSPSLWIHCCVIRWGLQSAGMGSKNARDKLLSTQPRVGSWWCPLGQSEPHPRRVCSAAPAPALPTTSRALPLSRSEGRRALDLLRAGWKGGTRYPGASSPGGSLKYLPGLAASSRTPEGRGGVRLLSPSGGRRRPPRQNHEAVPSHSRERQGLS